jgi:hypothetical protein
MSTSLLCDLSIQGGPRVANDLLSRKTPICTGQQPGSYADTVCLRARGNAGPEDVRIRPGASAVYNRRYVANCAPRFGKLTQYRLDRWRYYHRRTHHPDRRDGHQQQRHNWGALEARRAR